MKVLIAHVGYRQYGGEDAAAESEVSLLQDRGHEVHLLNPMSSEFDSLPWPSKLGIAARPANHRHGSELAVDAIAAYAPDVVHVHNLFPLLGLGFMETFSRNGCGVLCTVHNYRMSCIAGTHVRAGKPCFRCVPGQHGPGVRLGCYRGSRLQSVVMARFATELWDCLSSGVVPQVTLPSQFMVDWYVGRGLSRRSVSLVPNYAAGAAVSEHRADRAAYVGRLSPEKGIVELIAAWPSTITRCSWRVRDLPRTPSEWRLRIGRMCAY